MDNEEKQTVVFLMAGIAAYFIIGSIPILIFTDRKLYYELGLLVGCLLAMMMTMHMLMVIRKSLYMERHQSAFITGNSVIRLLLVAGIMFLAVWTDFISVVTLLLGLMSLKISALLQPFFLKIFKIK